MNNDINGKYFDEVRKAIEDKIEVHDTRLNNHSTRIDEMEKDIARQQVLYQSMCEKIDVLSNSILSLVTKIEWLIRTFLLAGLGFIIWYIQQL